MKKFIKIIFLFAMILTFANTQINASTNYLNINENEDYDGYVILDFENATQTISEDGDVEGTIPLIIYNSDGSKNITMSDGSIYRYGYMAGAHAWRYEFVITGGFSSYSGSVRLNPRSQTSTTGYWSTYVSARTDVIELPLHSKGTSIVSQGGVVTGKNGKLYTVPYVPVYC